MNPRVPTLPQLRPARVHEAFGPGAASFAAITCAQSGGRVLWIAEAWQPESLHPHGVMPFFDPARLVMACSRDQTETLAVAEEALKDGAVALVVLEISRPLDLREGRRLQLAAKAGGATGLCLIPEGMGSNAAETRWSCRPVFEPDRHRTDSTLMQWELTKNKAGTTGVWHVRWDATAHRLDVVSPVGLGPGAPASPG
ncbi:ImuA family protein [Paracoccus aminophilus]|uniref:ImuA family protein n=1 Tax=Paracoccus aminophilus TaxID=34003 RepID=UPI0005A25C9E|nr:hypothetical protein [Paracoccus aminophilus]